VCRHPVAWHFTNATVAATGSTLRDGHYCVGGTSDNHKCLCAFSREDAEAARVRHIIVADGVRIVRG